MILRILEVHATSLMVRSTLLRASRTMR
jgi:hypothetical protein